MTHEIIGGGTDEAIWRPWLAEQHWAPLELARLIRATSIVVLAAHPDDEVLGVGVLLATLTTSGARIVIMWASDGEASHPHTGVDTARLARQRRDESSRALAALGVTPRRTARLALPDSELAEHESIVRTRLGAEVEPGSVVLAPWRGDGHPDHEACGRAAARVTAEKDAELLEFPIWAWHWASPADGRVPWRRARRVAAASEHAIAKSAAIACFSSQTEPWGPHPAQAPVLPPAVVARFLRGEELVLE